MHASMTRIALNDSDDYIIEQNSKPDSDIQHEQSEDLSSHDPVRDVRPSCRIQVCLISIISIF